MAVKNPQTLSEASRIAQMLEKKLEFASGHRILTKAPTPPAREWKRNNVTFKDHRYENHAIPNDDLMNLTDAIRDLKRDVRNMGRSANIRVATAGEGSPPQTNQKQEEEQAPAPKECQYCGITGHDMNSCIQLWNMLLGRYP